jgi:hypothetical protein
MRKTVIATLLAGALGVGYALAQAVPVPQVAAVNATADLIQVIPGGVPAAASKYGTVAQVTAISGYKDLGTITTDPAYTATTGVWNVFGHATGTITAVTLTAPASPGDGQRLCYWADQTTTTLTFTANTGQTIDASVLAAGVAKVSQCITYSSTTKAWRSSN